MDKLNHIIEHIKDVYGFEVVPCRIPKNDFQDFKLSIYVLIRNRVSERLFYFLSDKSPIKFLSERPDGEIWLSKKKDGKTTIEMGIRPIPAEASIYITDRKNIFKPSLISQNYKVELYVEDCKNSVLDIIRYNSQILAFPISDIGGIESIDAHFGDVQELKELLRDYKLRNILKI